ncbi:MAG: hypothetical protein LBT47_11795 [Deltaproteobacteria bacterium]|jgi:hypothetical protein|nr:hypothetical protein [Deltaproteobacteria bacterium]
MGLRGDFGDTCNLTQVLLNYPDGPIIFLNINAADDLGQLDGPGLRDGLQSPFAASRTIGPVREKQGEIDE